MSRLRITTMTAIAFVAMAALTLSSLAQQEPAQQKGGGGPGGGFGRGGGGGFGFGGGRGGGFGFGGGLIGLASNPGVQEELKLKDKQKAQVKTLSENYNQQTQELRKEMGFGRGGGQNGQTKKGGRRGQNGNPDAVAGGQNGGGGFGRNNGGGGGGGFGQNNGGGGQNNGGEDDGAVQNNGGGGFGQNNGGGGQNNGGGGGFGQDNGGGGQNNGGGGGFGQDNGGGGRGGFGQNGGGGGRGNRGGNFGGGPPDPERVQQMAMFGAAMNELRLSAEQALGKILDKSQVNRLTQIDLQLQGPDLILRPDIVDKLALDETQVEMLQEARGERRQLQRTAQKAQFELMRSFREENANQNANQNDDGPGGGGTDGGNQRGRGRQFNPEAMKKLFEDPAIRAQMEKGKKELEKIDNQFGVMVNKVLTKRQRAQYQKMLGPPFDRSKLGGPPWAGGGPGGRGPGGAAAKKGAVAKAGAGTDAENDDGENAAAVRSTPRSTGAAKPAAPKRKTMQDLRGVPDDKPDDQ